MRMEIFRWWKYMRQTHGTPRHYGKPANNRHGAKENATHVRQTRNGRRAHFGSLSYTGYQLGRRTSGMKSSEIDYFKNNGSPCSKSAVCMLQK